MMLLMFVIWVNYCWLQAISKLQNLCGCVGPSTHEMNHPAALWIESFQQPNANIVHILQHFAVDGQILPGDDDVYMKHVRTKFQQHPSHIPMKHLTRPQKHTNVECNF